MKRGGLLCFVFFCFAGNGATGREEGQKLSRTHHFSGISGGAWLHVPQERWRVGTRAACIPAHEFLQFQWFPCKFLEF
jgi:hypothetical protein